MLTEYEPQWFACWMIDKLDQLFGTEPASLNK